MKHLLSALLIVGTIGSAAAVGQHGNNPRLSGMVGAYDGLGGIISYTVPLNVQGMARSGLGLLAEGALGAGLNEDDFVMSSLLGLNLVFVMNTDLDVYGGLGIGSRFLPSSDVGIGGQFGVNFEAARNDLFVEAGSHPGNITYLGLGLRF